VLRLNHLSRALLHFGRQRRRAAAHLRRRVSLRATKAGATLERHAAPIGVAMHAW
jgi:hypothetical protein